MGISGHSADVHLRPRHFRLQPAEFVQMQVPFGPSGPRSRTEMWQFLTSGRNKGTSNDVLTDFGSKKKGKVDVEKDGRDDDYDDVKGKPDPEKEDAKSDS